MHSRSDAARSAVPGPVRLATTGAIIYSAYSRPYDTGGARVLHLFASGQYRFAPLRFFFQPFPGHPDCFALVERVPDVVSMMRYYVAASYSSASGASSLADSVRIVDAHGEHVVGIEALA